MFGKEILKQLSRLTINSTLKIPSITRNISCSAVVQFKITDQLWAEPLKKKKKMDPAIVKAREERRRKRLEKQIRRLEKNARQLKPIEEVEPPLHLLDEKGKRKRPSVTLSEEEIESRSLLLKEWTRYKRQEYMANIVQIDRIMSAQKRALDMLYEESEELYNEAIMMQMLYEESEELYNEAIMMQMLYEESEKLYNEAIMPDLQLVPSSFTGPYATPPIKNYESPDGEYIDVSKKWGK